MEVKVKSSHINMKIIQQSLFLRKLCHSPPQVRQINNIVEY